MYRFCVKYVSQPSWATGTGDPPKGIWACNGAYIFGHYNDEDCVVESSLVKGSPTIPLPGSHTFETVEGSSICYYFRIGARKSYVDARKIREIEFRFLPCRCDVKAPGGPWTCVMVENLSWLRPGTPKPS